MRPRLVVLGAALALGSSGDTLLVSALCSDESTNEQHLYLFRAP